MRIVGGEFRGRTLATPKSNDIRPTVDRTRESLFNILAHAHLGIEALSRGCKSALFVENSVEGRGLLWENIDAFGLHGRARMLRRDATDLGPSNNIEAFELVFADPPYGKGLGEKALTSAHQGGWIAPGALVILEERGDVQVSVDPVFAFLEERTFGDTKMYFFSYRAA